MRSRRPLSVNNSLVHGLCNYDCVTCGVNKRAYHGPRQYQPREVTEALVARVEEAGRAGVHVRYLANSGDGEPTLHPDFAGRMALFGRLRRDWRGATPPPEVSVVSNGARLARPGVLDALAENGISLLVSFPTPDAAAYGELTAGRADLGRDLLETVTPGIRRAMALSAAGRLPSLQFHLAPPHRDVVRRDFPRTVAFLAGLAREAGLGRVGLVLFPATSNRAGLVRSRGQGVDRYRDLFRAWHGRQVDGVRVDLSLSLRRFFPRLGEVADVVRAFDHPCLWNATLFIAADGTSACCNDQAVREPQGHVVRDTLAGLMAARERHRPGAVCAACDQRPDRLTGSLAARALGLAARVRLALAGPPAPAPAAPPRGAHADEDRILFGGGRYHLRVANDLESRRRAYGLVYRLYRAEGYAGPDPAGLWRSRFDALPETTTLLVERGGEAVGALTVVCDSAEGLPADDLYREELDGLRGPGRRLAELGALGVDVQGDDAPMVLEQLYAHGFLLATRLRGATDVMATVNPRHAAFYRRRLCFTPVGGTRACDKVQGAPAVLLRLDAADGRAALESLLARANRADGRAAGDRSCRDAGDEPGNMATLRRQLRPMDEAERAALLGDLAPAPGYDEAEVYRPIDRVQTTRDSPENASAPQSTPAAVARSSFPSSASAG